MMKNKNDHEEKKKMVKLNDANDPTANISDKELREVLSKFYVLCCCYNNI